MNQKLSWLLLSTLLGGAVLTGCSEKIQNRQTEKVIESHIEHPTELYYANMFGKAGYQYLLLLE